MTSMLVAVLLFGLFLSGCSLVQKVTDVAAENERIAMAVVKNRTLAFIDGSPDKADIVQYAAGKALAVLRDDPEAKLRELGEVADRVIPWEKLSEREERAVREVMALIGNHVVEGDTLSKRQRVRLSTALGWIVDAAEIVP